MVTISPHKLSEYSLSDVPIKRNYHFSLKKEHVTRWHHWGLFTSAFYNALSVFFPPGETMFIRAVQAHKPEVPANSLLRKQMDAFVQQEAVHGREHMLYNDAIRAAYPSIVYVENFVAWLVLTVAPKFGRPAHLAMTTALEHWTGILAEQVLNDGRLWLDAEQQYGLIWRWHALEETEHKAVAFDVYQYVYGTGFVAYIRRVSWLLIASVLMWTLVYTGFFVMLAHEYQIFNLYQHARLLYFQWWCPGFFSKVFVPFWEYFKPSYHPWEHDNRDMLKGMSDVAEQLKQLNGKH